MKKVRTRICLLLCFILALTLFGCKSSDSTPKPSGSQAPSPTVEVGGNTGNAEAAENTGIMKGSSFTVRMPLDIQTFQPWGQSSGLNIQCQLYDTLVWGKNGDSSEIIPWLATDWTVSDDGLTYVFTLRDDVAFTNGNPLNAKAVVDCWAITQDYWPAWFESFKAVTATGDYEVTITLNVPDAALLQKLTWPTMSIADPAAAAEYGPDDVRACIGSGAYYVDFDRYSPGQETVLLANENYWNEDAFPAIETLYLPFIQDSNTSIVALTNGEIDYMEARNYIDYYTISAYDGISSHALPDTPWTYWLNPSHGVLKDPAVREALTYFVNLDELNAAAFDGQGTVVHCPWKSTIACYIDYDGREYDPEKGLQLLADAGYKPEDITLELLDKSDVTAMSTALQAQFQAYGITVNMTTYDVSSFIALFREGNYDIAPYNMDMNQSNPIIGFGTWLSDTPVCKGLNLSETEPELWTEMRSLYSSAAACTTFEAQMDYLKELTLLICENNLNLFGVQGVKWSCYTENLINLVQENVSWTPQWKYARLENYN